MLAAAEALAALSAALSEVLSDCGVVGGVVGGVVVSVPPPPPVCICSQMSLTAIARIPGFADATIPPLSLSFVPQF